MWALHVQPVLRNGRVDMELILGAVCPKPFLTAPALAAGRVRDLFVDFTQMRELPLPNRNGQEVVKCISQTFGERGDRPVDEWQRNRGSSATEGTKGGKWENAARVAEHKSGKHA